MWQYRREAGASALCNFGRLHKRYVTSSNRKQGLLGRRLGSYFAYTGHAPALQFGQDEVAPAEPQTLLG